MNLKDYINGALRTESEIKQAHVTNKDQFINILTAYAVSAQLLDMYKKNIFYNKPIDKTKLQNAINDLNAVATSLCSEQPEEQYNSILNINPRILHGIVGVATESGELIENVIKQLNNKSIDNINIAEEIGDVCWYQAILVDALGADWDQILERNLAKLKKRYPEKFTTDNAINRNVDEERKILESNLVIGNKAKE